MKSVSPAAEKDGPVAEASRPQPAAAAVPAAASGVEAGAGGIPAGRGGESPWARVRAGWPDFAELVKVRLNALVIVTTLFGFWLGWSGPMDYVRLLHTLFGVTLVAWGTSALNQWLERDVDAKMLRTQDRPLPAGRWQPDAALLVGFALAMVGLADLFAFVSLAAAGLTALTLGIYLFVYTPMKRFTSLNTLVGAVPGALPPTIGWVAATNAFDLGAWVLFGILFFWQLPHFLAIAWLYREDYLRGGFVMLAANDERGDRTGRLSVLYAMALLMVSLLPAMLGLAHPFFFFGAFLLGAGVVAAAGRLQRRPSRPRARQLFFSTIIYLPLLLILWVCCRI